MNHDGSSRHIEWIKTITWSPPQFKSSLLQNIGINHGFSGVTSRPPENLISLKQVHGTTIVNAVEAYDQALEIRGDGIISRIESFSINQPVAVRTADCLPILISNKDGSIVAAIHAGWRGLTKGILGFAIKSFCENPNQLIAVIGPSISRESFEVGPEVIDALQGSDLGLSPVGVAHCISKGKDDRWHADLRLAASLSLIEQGLSPSNLEVINSCTKLDNAYWHSYRREGPGVKSNWSWIQCTRPL